MTTHDHCLLILYDYKLEHSASEISDNDNRPWGEESLVNGHYEADSRNSVVGMKALMQNPGQSIK